MSEGIKAGIRTIEIKTPDLLLDQVCRVLHEAHEEEYKSSGLIINTSSITKEILGEQLEAFHGCCLAALEGDQVIGTLTLLDDTSGRWYKGNRPCKRIKYVAVRPSLQGTGIATHLLTYAKEMISAEGENSMLTVSTDERNRHAIHVYEKNGFRRIDLSRGYDAPSNAVMLAYWSQGCPYSQAVINRWLLQRKAVCTMKSILQKVRNLASHAK